jgi:Loader and inhibitor of phage G40P.
MTRNEIKKLIAIALGGYPNMQKLNMTATVDAWEACLSDMEFDFAKMALAKTMLTNKFFPTVAEIREAGKNLVDHHNRVPTAEEAWAEVLKRIQQPQYGYYFTDSADELKERPPEAKWSHPLIGEIVKNMGGLSALRRSENNGLDRYNFLESYKRQEKTAFDRLTNNTVLKANGFSVEKLIAAHDINLITNPEAKKINQGA